MKLFQYVAVIMIMATVSLTGFVDAAELKFAHVYETSHPLHKAAEQAAKLFSERSKGKHSIKVFPASSLGKEADLNEGLSLGTVDIIYTGPGFVGSVYGPASMTDFPFTLRNLKHWEAYYKSKTFKDVAKGYANATGGNEISAVSYYGSRHVTANKPILRPADMKNLKIRVPNAPAYVLFPKAVGANPTPMAFSEVYLALQQGVVDAQENPLPTIQAKKFYEVQSHINLTGHIVNSIFTIVSSVRLQQMNNRDKRILKDILVETAQMSTDAIISSEEELVSWFRNRGVNVNEVDRAPFIKAVAPALTSGDLPFPKTLYQKLQSIRDAR